MNAFVSHNSKKKRESKTMRNSIYYTHNENKIIEDNRMNLNVVQHYL